MGKKARTVIMSLSLINEIIMIIIAALSAAAIRRISVELPAIYGVRTVLSLIIGAVGVLFAAVGLKCVLKDEKNTLLFAALWFGLIANAIRTLSIGLSTIMLLRTFHSVNANVPAHGQVNISLLLTSGRGVLCFLLAALMVAMLFDLSGKEEQ